MIFHDLCPALTRGLALLIALGTGLFFVLIPGLAQFRCPGRTAVVLGVLAPLLAASGLDTLLAGEGRLRWWLLLVLVGQQELAEA